MDLLTRTTVYSLCLLFIRVEEIGSAARFDFSQASIDRNHPLRHTFSTEVQSQPTEKFFGPLNFSQAAINYHNPSTNTRHWPVQTDSNECGTMLVGQNLIAGGAAIQRGRWPWLAAIFRLGEHSKTFLCGGTLVSRKAVVSAAHCFMGTLDAANYQILLGQHNIERDLDSSSVAMHSSAVHVHPAYGNDKTADIAVVILRDQVGYNEYIRPACLWPSSVNIDDIQGRSGVVAGWGRNEDAPITPEPKRASVRVVSENECRTSSQELRRLSMQHIFCASNINMGSPCEGDSGSGLLFTLNNRWTLRGTVASGIGMGCNSYIYVIYADVGKFRSWIDQKISS